jgi:hypothetical protein
MISELMFQVIPSSKVKSGNGIVGFEEMKGEGVKNIHNFYNLTVSKLTFKNCIRILCNALIGIYIFYEIIKEFSECIIY